jgi:hypothetical protein
MFDPGDWTDQTLERAGQYADEEVREWGGRLEWEPSVMKVLLPSSANEPITTWRCQDPEPLPGVAWTRGVTCGCRKQYMLPVLALVFAAIRVATGLAGPGTWVRPMRVPLLELPYQPGESVYSINSDGKLVIDLHERR